MKRIVAIIMCVTLVLTAFSACSESSEKEKTATESITAAKTQATKAADYNHDMLTYAVIACGVMYYYDPYQSDEFSDWTGNMNMVVDNDGHIRSALESNEDVESVIAEDLERDLFTRKDVKYPAVTLRFISKEQYTPTDSYERKNRYFYKINIERYLYLNDCFAGWDENDDIYAYVTLSIKERSTTINVMAFSCSQLAEGSSSGTDERLDGISNPSVTYYNIVEYDDYGEVLDSAGGYLLDFTAPPEAVGCIFRYHYGDEKTVQSETYRLSNAPFCFSGQESPSKIDVQLYDDDSVSEWVTVFGADTVDYYDGETITHEDWETIINNFGYTVLDV